MANPENASRRDFLKTSAVTAGVMAGLSTITPAVHAAGDGTIKVGLVGCGGRGTGAAREALKATNDAKLVAMADISPDAIKNSHDVLKDSTDLADRVDVPPEMRFVGLGAYQQLIKSVDVVLLASPPGFRPYHLKAAVEAKKHVFCEKPMATDAPGVRSVMESVKIAKEHNLALVAGFCWRYDYARRELMQQIHDGAIGDVVGIYGTYLTGPVKPMMPPEDRPKGISDLEWMVRNWYNFTWLSGDGLVEQAIHTVDWLAWVMKDRMPTQCTAVGGRQIPQTGGNIWDHIEVNYEWGDGVRGFLAQRQIPGCHGENSLHVMGTKGSGFISPRGVYISGANAKEWKADRRLNNNMYQTEHDELFQSIKDGKPINDGDRMAKSTMMGIMGRMAGYTGQLITWEQAINSQELLAPEITDWNMKINVPGTAMPGLTQFR